MEINYRTTLIYFFFVLTLTIISQVIVSFIFTNEVSLLFVFLVSLFVSLGSFIIFLLIKKNIGKISNNRISDLEQKYSDLSKKHELYEIASKATNDTIWDWNIKTNGFIWNEGIEFSFGHKKESIENNLQWWFNKIHPEDSLKISVKLYESVNEKLEKWQDEYRFLCADATYKYVSNRGFLIKDETGIVVRMIGSIQDVTKQKREEQRLKLLETVITQTKDSVIITETQEKEKGIPKVVYVNPAFYNMTGYKPKEVIGKSPTVFIGKNIVKNNIKQLADALKKKEEFTFESLNNKKNGDEYWVNFSMIPITNNDNLHSHWISIQRDISIEKHREKEREQLIAELTQNNKDLKQFSYITSHNLRAPLSNLTGLLNLINDIPIENEELKEIISGFSKSTALLNETINDLVKVVIIKDSLSIQKEDLEIKEIFENVFNQLSFLISIKKPLIKMDFDKAPIVNVNKSYFESILLNLMTNSLKYKDDIRQLKIIISSKKVGNTILVTFKDNGIGIDMKLNKDKIFGLYQRFHDYPDSKGLGLYLVKSQVESMGGKISVNSEVGVGTTFEITLKTNTNA